MGSSNALWLFLAIAAAAWLVAEVVSRVVRQRRAVGALRHTWGQDLRGSRKYRAPQTWFLRLVAPTEAGLDDQTWNDLELDRVLTWVDRTLTAFGAQILYTWLRCPVLSARTEPHPRLALARALADPDVRVPLQRELVRLGDRHGWDSAMALVDPGPPLWGPAWMYTALAIAVLPAIAIGAMTANLPALLLGLALAAVNPSLHYAASRRTEGFLSGLRAVRDGVAAAARLHRELPEAVRERYPQLSRDLELARKAVRFSGSADALPVGSVGGQFADVIVDYHRAFFLTEVRAYLASVAGVHRYRAELQRVLSFVGEIDAALSLAYLLEHEPHLCEATSLAEPRALRATALRHPLLPEAVANDVGLGARSMLVTGSNMAGKSTFLRTLGVNVVLAQTVGIADADALALSPLRVFASMEVHDDLAASVSLYQAELKRILVLVREGAADPPALMLLDEVFRGTNPTDRLAASGAVLLELCERNLVVAATHDLELAVLTEGRFDLGHFTERVDEAGVHFDYRLEPGLVQSTNALALLGRMGFPERVVQQAERFASARR